MNTIEGCPSCGEPYCTWCNDLVKCEGCDESCCESCQDDFSECEGCKRQMCQNCDDKFDQCECGFKCCEDCTEAHQKTHKEKSDDLDFRKVSDDKDSD